LTGETGRMSAIKRLSNNPYRIEFISVPVEEVANKEKKVPLDWITEDGHDVTKDMIEYLKPLIQGETKIQYENGIPRQMKLF
jgi:6-phosphofructokinase 1